MVTVLLPERTFYDFVGHKTELRYACVTPATNRDSEGYIKHVRPDFGDFA